MDRAFDRLVERMGERLIDDELRSMIDRIPTELNELGYDDWGFDPHVAVWAVAIGRWFYRNYFRVESEGIENIPATRALVIANHGGQLPVEGFMLGTTVALEADPPRVLRGMVERWMPTIPFISPLFFRCGQIVGTREDCTSLLNRDEAVMVFPEGTRGSGKTLWDAYELQRFGHGFMRIALATGTPIIPVGIVGHEESIPSVAKLASLSKLLGIPYVYVPASLPFLGPLALLPMPTKFYIQIGEPMFFEGSPDATEREVALKVEEVKDAIRGLIDRGLEKRRGIFEFGIEERVRHMLGMDIEASQ